ncbi:MAG: cell division topological specificity factor MinE [Vampirovibrionales bacterium]
MMMFASPSDTDASSSHASQLSDVNEETLSAMDSSQDSSSVTHVTQSVVQHMTPPEAVLPSVASSVVVDEPKELLTKESVQRSIQFVGDQLNQLWHNRDAISKRSMNELHRFTGLTKQALTEVSHKIQESIQTGLVQGQASQGSPSDEQRLWQKRERSEAARRIAFDRLRIVLESDREQLTEEVQARIQQDMYDVLSRYLTLEPSDVQLEVCFEAPLSDETVTVAPSQETIASEVLPSIQAHVRHGKRRRN